MGGRYVVGHRYWSYRDGRSFGPYEPGDVVELDAADAAWLERDSPGLLTADPVPEPARQAPPPADRQARPGRNRSR